MAFTLWWGVLSFTLVFVYLLDKRYRLECLEEELEERELQQAIEERVRGANPASTRAGRGVQVRFAEYVIGGWVLTGAVLGAYWVRLRQRTRRAERSLPPEA